MTETRRTDHAPSRPSDRGPGPGRHQDTDAQEEGPATTREDIRDRRPTPEPQAFRVTFLWRFYRPEVITAFRLVGDALCDLQNEAGAWGPKGGPSITWSEIAAACEDLGHLAVYLDEVAGERTASELDEVSEALSVNAGRWAGQLARLVLDMRRSLDRAAEVLDHDAHSADPGIH